MKTKAVCHLVAMPFPGRGHINPMMNLCKLLSSRRADLLITFVITEEWSGYIGSEPKPEIVQFRTIPNGIIPPERLKAADFLGFYEAVMTKMESPFEQLLDQLQPPVTAIIGDIEVRWAIGVGTRRNIPVAAFWTMSASFFSMLYHLDVSAKAHNSSPEDLIDCGDLLPGISTSRVSELKKLFQKNDLRVLQLAIECVSKVTKAQYLLFTSIHELEVETMDSLSQTFPFPVYPIGPAIPYLELLQNPTSSSIHQWLNNQPTRSVLYISLGSFLSVSSTQMDEILSGLRSSGVRFLWVARGEATRLSQKMMSGGDQNGMVVAWCDQLKVLSHCSVGGFWSHCGWNSTLESFFSGVPMLTFPLFLDQDSNSKLIVEELGVGWELAKGDYDENIRAEEIAEIVQKFMNVESEEVGRMRRRAREVGDICNGVTKDGGSSVSNLDAFITGISQAV
uniref:UDP-glycosyltransferase 1 n=1 Tax=Linum usitatissimum TaxID=4006 RepID=I2BHC1_LINUS|nr:UDP-glycosyltransferase 1 [Linum usitatissimum]